jgi:hypothetical protein
MLRRAGLVLIAFCPFYEVPQTLQIIAVLFVNLLYNIYVGQVEPFNLRRKNNTELFNEVTIFYASMSLFFFTDFNPFVEMQNAAGWIIIGVVLLNMLTNWGLFMKGLVSKLYLWMKTKYLKCKKRWRHLQKKARKREIERIKKQLEELELVMMPAKHFEQ